MSWLGIDIGGANIKLSDGDEYAHARPFAMWKHADELVQHLRHAISEAPTCDHMAVSMTGELADCFATKSDGVNHILAAVEAASDGRHARVYLTDGRFVTPSAAKRRPELAAASNWHALANFARRYVASSGFLIDVGSTTTDIVPITCADVVSVGTTDTERLLAGELWYSGVSRNPVCGLVQQVPYRDHECTVAQEYFATMRDVYLVLGKLPESPSDSDTADGRPATKAFAKVRLGRMICADETEFHHKDAATMAEHIASQQTEKLAGLLVAAAEKRTARPETLVISGEGEFLIRNALQRLNWGAQIVTLQNELGVRSSRSATAHALAVLASEKSP